MHVQSNGGWLDGWLDGWLRQRQPTGRNTPPPPPPTPPWLAQLQGSLQHPAQTMHTIAIWKKGTAAKISIQAVH